ncbi:MAG: hypothetical protein E6Q77_08655 [Rhizobium sp.]|nr:MAG: hypothetical protein E6Q77_08655 [Rhizobium sp.]
MKNVDEEIERIQCALRGLEAKPDPSPELSELIDYYKNQALLLSRRSSKYFKPYRNDLGELVINEFGDCEGDV